MIETKSRISQSCIPVKVSRPAQSALPSTLSVPNLGLVPSSRHLSVSDSPTHPSPGSSSSVSSTGGGITPLRSFRSLLPFGSGSKHPVANLSPGGSKSSFVSFNSIRRSINGDRSGERSVSAPQLRTSRSQEHQPVFHIGSTPAIQLSYKVNEPLISQEDFHGLDLYVSPQKTSSPKSAPAQTRTFEAQAAPSPVQLTLGISDLSTIMESETSGISKHIPHLDDSQDQHEDERIQNTSFLLAPPDNGGYPQPESQDTSALDLSMSDVRNQVLEALTEAERPEGWLHGVVVDDAESPTGNVPGAGDMSFDLGAIDADLAAILSPNSLRTSASKRQTGVDSLAPPYVTSPLGQSPRSSRSPSPATTVPASLPDTSPRRRSTSLSRPAASKLPAITTDSRLTRSVSERPTHVRPPLPSPTARVSPSRSSDIGERPSLAARRLGSSPLSSERELSHRPSTGTEVEIRRPPASRLKTPARLASPGSTSRPLFRQASSPTSTTHWDADSVSPSSHSPSSMSAPPGRTYGRPSLDNGAQRLSALPLRSRDRSASLSESPLSAPYHTPNSQHSTVERMGPRTAKAFAAAGLIDADRDASGLPANRSISRFGLSRSDRDYRSQRSGSISRTGAMSEVTSAHLSETLSTPRTTFSAASTAPTSISANSSPHYALGDMQKIHDQHSLQTSTLMNALADSQLTTRLLREENIQLRDRIHDLENRLSDAMSELQRLQFVSLQPQAQASSLSRSNFRRVAGSAGSRATEFGFKRSLPQHSQPSTLRSDNGNVLEPSPEIIGPSGSARTSSESRRDGESYPKSSHRRRFSNSSSIFPGPPSTMSMLLHEDGAVSDVPSRSPSSPTLVLSKLPTRQSQGSSQHSHHRAASSGNISPTTANFSMLTGSPGSLNLRPEHERLLGDMPMLDLCAGDYERSDFEVPIR
ncbi:unnamed protein product [Somion occarium]|uniref:Uncharacterized protein n=1 Tax=Somion occarium TaxID=3059160 RepID=A0ABP1CSJ0_9APHY